MLLILTFIGLSLLFFILSIVGNATYGCGVSQTIIPETCHLLTLNQILFHSIEKEYFLINLPWLIGSLGTMAEDIFIFVQFRLYSTGSLPSSTAIE